MNLTDRLIQQAVNGPGKTSVLGNSLRTGSNPFQNDIYGFVFGQKGLMAGVGLQGSKITKINR